MQFIDTIVIGGGQAGLATSRCLKDLGVDHLVVERGRVGESWHSQRWDSLRLLTPNWQTRLPGFCYRGSDPEGFMRADELANYLENYARSFDAPIMTQTSVLDVRRDSDGNLAVTTDRGSMRAGSVVIATGACQIPNVPAFAAGLSPRIDQIVPSSYKHPGQVKKGGVLVVGASATGVQLAEELHRSGRPVTISVGQHTRVPRRYRGQDIMAWLDAMGILDERLSHRGIVRPPSLQLRGDSSGRSLDLASLQAQGIHLVGELANVQGTLAYVDSNLEQTVRNADAKLDRLLTKIDHWISLAGLEHGFRRDGSPAPVEIPTPRSIVDLDLEGIQTVVWATGFRCAYPWLNVKGATDPDGQIRPKHGQTNASGVYALGLPNSSRRNATFIDGVGADAQEIANEIKTQCSPRSKSAA